MASISTSISPIAQNQNRFDLNSIRVLVLSVDRHILQFLEDSETQKRLQLNCNSKLKIQKQEFFEFSEQAVLSNLYWGIENVESAIRAVTQEDRATYLKNAEKMLQIPALLEEYGSTGGISNRYLVCCAYFYLSLIWKLEGDEWQMTLHFLQAVLVSPRHVRREFAPELWEFLFLNRIVGGNEEMGGQGGIHSKSVVGFREDAIDDLTKQMARRYKDWMMYYRVVLYGETPQWLQRCADACTHELESSDSWYKNPASSKHSDSDEQVTTWPIFHDAGMIPRLDLQENTNEEDRLVVTEKKKAFLMVDGKCHDAESDEMYHSDTIGERKIIKCLQDMLKESQSDTSISIHSCINSAEGSDFEEKIHDNDMLEKIRTMDANLLASEIGSRKLLGHGSISLLECVEMSPPEAPRFPVHEESYDLNTSYFFSSRSHGSENDINLSFMDPSDTDLASFHSCCIDDGAMHQRSPSNSSRSFDYRLSKLGGQRKSAREKAEFSNSEKNPSEVSLYHGNDDHMEMLGRFEKAISNLCFSEGLRKCEDAGLEVSIVREIVNSKTGMKYGLLKEVILSQLLDVISTSKEDKIVRALIAILLVLISENHSIIEDIKRKNSYLCDLGNALKRNVHEAAVLIYLLNPSPTEIKDLELLSLLVEAACNSNSYVGPISLPLTPTAASIMMIEALVTKLDYATSNMHLEVISSPQVLSRLVNVARHKNLEEGASLAGILISCMRFDAKCRNYLAQVAPVATFLHLLRSNKRHAKFAALEFFHEILRIPRSSATSLLHQIRRVGNINIMHTLMACIQQAQMMHQLFAANLLLQLDMMEDSFGKSIFREEAIEALLESVASEESPDTQALSAFILSNLGGTYAWTGESYTVAWLLKKTGLTSMYHKNMIRNIDWSDQCLKDAGIDPCCSKVARSIIKIGNPVFHTLEKGLRSNTRSVSRDCLIAISWLGCEVAIMDPSCLGYSVRETLLNGIVHFLHPGSDLEEKLLACLCVYKYASGKGMQSLMNVSEAVRESLRRLSGITWMADELLKVADYFLPTESQHVSCVHTQILEVGHNGIGATNALIFYKGQLYSGHSDGSIKVWNTCLSRALSLIFVT
ncbi:putative E3 ubiquitin-protein ligase LIN-1 isoform X1 [Magnolia sinica]|uniref:putative E3 ubiquitin-protein ligase LIN-1 isoform X1 n=1 Tax=Magnolia sinica TaxID=86752 RepID=UPI002658D979|nr:putative E3 ubiquitin-protein ligase LIN-1 isoform X1 [Magnolia sinica]